MMKRNIILISALFLLLTAFFAGCSREDQLLRPESQEVPDGYVAINVSFQAPDMQVVSTRAVDQDGTGVNSMTLFCFDSYGLFITTVAADLAKDPPMVDQTVTLSGQIKATVPERTERIHFVANQNMTSFSENDFRNKTEAEVIATLEGSAGMLIYWARFVNSDESKKIDEVLEKEHGTPEKPIYLIRNQARVTVSSSSYFTVTGFEVCNVYAFGTVAPYNIDNGFPTVEEWQDVDINNENRQFGKFRDWMMLPTRLDKLSDIQDVKSGEDYIYIFEHPNTESDPVSVIIHGHNADETEDLYYRVMLLDGEGNTVPIRRNTTYKLSIDGPLSYGQPTFEAATTAAATNNVWLSISDDINSVQDANYILTVDETSVIYSYAKVENETSTSPNPASKELTYTLELVGEGTLSEKDDEPEVSWFGDNTVADIESHKFIVNGKTGTGTITIKLRDFTDRGEGTILVKKGHLQRKIKVITINTQSFVPAWVSTEVYAASADQDKESSHVTLMFNIPETCPSELFPMEILITAASLDLRDSNGALPLVFKGDTRYNLGNKLGENNEGDVGYKYVYTAEEPGVQRVYFWSKLPHDDGDIEYIYIESNHFELMTKEFQFINAIRNIASPEMLCYQQGEYANDIVYYYLVPQKVGAPVDIHFVLTDGESATPVNANSDAEFLLYSGNLGLSGDTEIEVQEYLTISGTDENTWKTSGRRLLFYPNTNEPATTGEYSISLETRVADSDEVVRLASNEVGAASLRYPDEDDEKHLYGQGENNGLGYRSFVFELANYHPFSFYSTVNGVGSKPDGSDWDTALNTPLTWTYVPNQEVNIEIDITSFAGAGGKLKDGTDVAGKSVDPFGREFEIYIDAPMLDIDTDRLAECNLNSEKLKEDPDVPGRFIYTVDADRKTEAGFGVAVPLQPDDKYADGDRSGERKCLPFKTNTCVSAGNIVISSNTDQVVYLSETYTISNESITGSIKYGTESSNSPIPAKAFVTLERKSNGSRIGSMTITADGQYELRLRKEYEFNWYADAIEITYNKNNSESGTSTVYSLEVTSLGYLFGNPDIVLIEQE